MAIGYFLSAVLMGLAFLWFIPDGSDALVPPMTWGLALNIPAVFFSVYAGLDTAYTLLGRCPSIRQLCCGSCLKDPTKPKQLADRNLKLYEGAIEPSDLCQGQVGDCWLVAAIASAAEHPAAIRNVFITKEYSAKGKYRVRLYHPSEKKWKIVTIDDRLPCKKGTRTPLFMQMQGDEVWAVLLEKAFAKLAGSYSALSGGFVPWGWFVMTGDYCFQVKNNDDGSWMRLDIEFSLPEGKTDVSMYKTKETFNSDQLWNLVLAYLQNNSILGAGGVRKNANSAGGAGLNNEAVNEDAGLVEGHAYSILEARELGLIPGLNLGGGVLGQVRLIKVRNPWGSFEWKGAWSKNSKEWDENPLVRAALRPKNVEDGAFWMDWNDFQTTFTRVDFCDRTTKFDINLDIAEDMGPGGLFWSCVNGLMRFLCLCQGFFVIYFGRQSTGKTLSHKRGGLTGFCQCIGNGGGKAQTPATVQIEQAQPGQDPISRL